MVCNVATVKFAGACLVLAEVPDLTFRISHVNSYMLQEYAWDTIQVPCSPVRWFSPT